LQELVLLPGERRDGRVIGDALGAVARLAGLGPLLAGGEVGRQRGVFIAATGIY